MLEYCLSSVTPWIIACVTDRNLESDRESKKARRQEIECHVLRFVGRIRLDTLVATVFAAGGLLGATGGGFLGRCLRHGWSAKQLRSDPSDVESLGLV